MTMMKHVKKVMMALLLAAGMTGSVNGAIVYYSSLNYTVNPGGSFDYDPTTGLAATGSDYIRLQVSNGAPPYFASLPSSGTWQTLRGTEPPLSGETHIILTNGTTIEASVPDTNWGSWAANLEVWSAGVSQGYHAYDTAEYYGIRSEVSPGTYGYGWIEIYRSPTDSWTILASAFNDSGTYVAGQTPEGGGEGGGGSAVPEPGTAAMLGIGVAILSASRRRFRREG